MLSTIPIILLFVKESSADNVDEITQNKPKKSINNDDDIDHQSYKLISKLNSLWKQLKEKLLPYWKRDTILVFILASLSQGISMQLTQSYYQVRYNLKPLIQKLN